MSYKLFLDDFRQPRDAQLSGSTQMLLEASETDGSDWLVVRTYDDFIKTIEDKGMPEMISFDHDLTPTHMKIYMQSADRNSLNYNAIGMDKTGYHCAMVFEECWMEMDKPKVKVYIHTANHIGARNIKQVLWEVIGGDYTS